MTEKYIFVEHLTNLNETIKQPLQITQRIKFTCFDVSRKYIVFGATSGGLYIFQRHPCEFVKLIPNTEGPIVNVSISPDEKSVVLSSAKGLLIVLENCFTESDLTYHQYTEHEESLITTIKWQNSDIYSGDNNGKVSVISLPSLLSKAIFQTPCTALMTLDSSIVQIDIWRKFLLISTNTRTYLCDTEKEQYKQLGKKLREGPFGACFFNKSSVSEKYVPPKLPSMRSFFQTASESGDVEDMKIFCTRPGVRLWEVDFDCSVVCTHQFKNSLFQPPASIIHLSDDKNGTLKITDYEDVGYNLPEAFNFGKIFPVANKFMFTFNKDAVYVFEHETVSLLFWSNNFTNIVDVKISNNFMYLWTEEFEMHVVSINTLEDLILQTLFNRQYFVCAELCVKFADFVQGLIRTSNRIHLISVLKEKLVDSHLIEALKPLLNKIQEFSETKHTGQKMKSGIYVVDNAHSVMTSMYNKPEPNSPETFQVLKEISTTVTDKFTEGTRSIKEKLQLIEATVKNLTVLDHRKEETPPNVTTSSEIDPPEPIVSPPSMTIVDVDPVSDINYNLNVLYRQYEMNKINHNIVTPNHTNLLESKNQTAIVELFHEFTNYIEELKDEKKQAEEWCFKQFLSHLSKKNLHVENSKVFQYALTGFMCVNENRAQACSCKYPLPIAKSKAPQFYNVGCQLLKNNPLDLDLVQEITTRVPFMWKFVLKDVKTNESIHNILPLIVQYSDDEIFKYLLESFTYDIWDEASKLLIKLKQHVCLNCDQKILSDESISWTSFGTLMTESIGGVSTLKLLKRYARFIANGELDASFYQTCILTAAVDNLENSLRKETVNFVQDIHSDGNTAVELDNIMGGFLNKKYLKSNSYEQTLMKAIETGDCSYCGLPLKIEILGPLGKASCSHSYHTICLNYNKNLCSLCKLHCDG